MQRTFYKIGLQNNDDSFYREAIKGENIEEIIEKVKKMYPQITNWRIESWYDHWLAHPVELTKKAMNRSKRRSLLGDTEGFSIIVPL